MVERGPLRHYQSATLTETIMNTGVPSRAVCSVTVDVIHGQILPPQTDHTPGERGGRERPSRNQWTTPIFSVSSLSTKRLAVRCWQLGFCRCLFPATR